MTSFKDIMMSGKAPNDMLNMTTAEAESMAAYFKKIFEGSEYSVIGVFVNQVTNSAAAAGMIPLEEIEPKPPADVRLFYAVGVDKPEENIIYWDVYSWYASVKSNGVELATRNYMLSINKSFAYLNVPATYKAIETTLKAIYAKS